MLAWRWPREDAKRRRWRRRTLCFFSLLAIGAVLNVLVTWGCVWYGEEGGWGRPVHQHDPKVNSWPFAVRAPAEVPACVREHRSIGYRRLEAFDQEVTQGDNFDDNEHRPNPSHWCPDHFASYMLYATVMPVPESENHYVREALAGWPFRCLRTRIHLLTDHWGQSDESVNVVGVNPYHDARLRPTFAGVFVGGIPAHRFAVASARPGLDWTLPIRPLPLGFAANTLFYGFASVVTSVSVHRLFTMRSRRRRRIGLCLACGYDCRGLSKCPECGREHVTETEVLMGVAGGAVSRGEA